LAANRWKRHRASTADNVQIIGAFLEHRTTIAFAGMVEREFGGFTSP
jgi:amidase